MKIAICSSVVPHVDGGYRKLADGLRAVLSQAGHNVEQIYLPQVDAPDSLFHQMMAYRWIDLTAADRIICLRPPAHAIPHPHKIVWFIHHLRIFYDLWQTPYRSFPDDLRFRGIREALHNADSAAIQESRRVFCNSQVVADRLQRFNNVKSEVLYPPLFSPERFFNRPSNDEIVCVCRTEHAKRQHLLVEAMRFTKTPVKLRLCGIGSQDYTTYLWRSIKRSPAKIKIHFENRWISEEEKCDAFANCVAVAYVPFDEDSYGYPTLEASHSSKPILTTSDSGGVLELVRHESNGLIAEPSAEALADAMDRLYLDPGRARRMGENARERLGELNISWDRVVEKLLA